jgi:hypothetical protein
MTDTESANRTRYMARAVGLFLLVFGVVVVVRSTTLYLLIPAFFQDGALVFVTGVLGMALGAAMIAAHNRWNSLPAIIISAFGWITFIRSALIVIAPAVVASIAANAARIQILPVIAGLGAALIGSYLIFVGWFSRDRAAAA